MKANLTKVCLALLSTAFLLGCQDQASGPVGLDGLGPQFAKAKECPGHPSCKDGGGGGGGLTVAEATVMLSDGMFTSSAQDLRIHGESDSHIGFQDVREKTGASTFRSEINLTATRDAALADFSECVVDPADTPVADIEALLDFLEDPEQIRFLLLFMDKALPSTSSGNGIASTWDDESGKLISLRVGTNTKPFAPGDGATATLMSGNINSENFTVVFSGGSVQIKDRTGKTKDHVGLTCPNKDTIEVAVTRLP